MNGYCCIQVNIFILTYLLFLLNIDIDMNIAIFRQHRIEIEKVILKHYLCRSLPF